MDVRHRRIVAAIMGVGCLAVVLTVAWFVIAFFTTRGQFTRISGFSWPANAKVISTGDNHGGFLGDGEFHVVFKADRATLTRWLEQSPPWDQGQWKRGPVPREIEFHCQFDGHRALFEESLYTDETWYAARERCCENLRWHNGELLVIDLTNRRVWLCVWDF